MRPIRAILFVCLCFFAISVYGQISTTTLWNFKLNSTTQSQVLRTLQQKGITKVLSDSVSTETHLFDIHEGRMKDSKDKFARVQCFARAIPYEGINWNNAIFYFHNGKLVSVGLSVQTIASQKQELIDVKNQFQNFLEKHYLDYKVDVNSSVADYYTDETTDILFNYQALNAKEPKILFQIFDGKALLEMEKQRVYQK